MYHWIWERLRMIFKRVNYTKIPSTTSEYHFIPLNYDLVHIDPHNYENHTNTSLLEVVWRRWKWYISIVEEVDMYDFIDEGGKVIFANSWGGLAVINPFKNFMILSCNSRYVSFDTPDTVTPQPIVLHIPIQQFETMVRCGISTHKNKVGKDVQDILV